MSRCKLAQLNIAKLVEPLDSPRLADFVANLDRINELAEQSPGFVWRLQTDDGDATALRPFGEDTIVNLSVWEDLESLRNYVYKSAHVEILRRRNEWFEKTRDAHLVLWWIEAGHIPTTDEARERLDILGAEGPTQRAFTFGSPFPPLDEWL